MGIDEAPWATALLMRLSMACRSFQGARLDAATFRRLLGLLSLAEIEGPTGEAFARFVQEHGSPAEEP